MLTNFWEFLKNTPRHQQAQRPAPAKTILFYHRGGVPFVTDVDGGPGGIIDLTDEETSALLKEIDIAMYAGLKLGDLTSAQILNTETYAAILSSRAAGEAVNEESSLNNLGKNPSSPFSKLK